MVSSVYRHTQIYYTKAFKEIGITTGQFMFILCIYDNPGITQDFLSNELDMNKSTVARVIWELETEKYVKRIENKTDKRKYHIYLTKKGEALYPKISKIVQSYNENIVSHMSEEEITYLTKCLEKMRQNVVNISRGGV